MKMTGRHGSEEAMGLLLVLAVVVSNVNGICWNCMPPNLSEEETERIIAIDFKKRLMEKLGMTKEPEVPKDAEIPAKEIIDDLLHVENDVMMEEDNGTINAVFLQALNNDSPMSNTTFEYKVGEDELNGYRVNGVTLWVYINDATSWYQVYEKMPTLPRRLVSMAKNHHGSGWRKVIFTPNKLWLKNPWTMLRIEIEGIGSPVVRKPLLELDIKRIEKRIVRRSAAQPTPDPFRQSATGDCNANDKHCCLHYQIIDLPKHMKFVKWPTSYRAFTCKGSCPLNHRYNNTWTFISQKEALTNSPQGVNKKYRRACCVPTDFQDLTILYWDIMKTIGPNGKVILNHVISRRVIPNMVATRCGCV